MRIISYKFVFLITLISVQIACGQTRPKDTSSKVIVLPNEAKESKSDVKFENTINDAEEIKSLFPNLKKQTDLMQKAFIAEDFDKYTDFMYPTLVDVVGGKEKFISNLVSSISNLRSNGVEFQSFKVGEPIQAILMDDKVFVVLSYETKMKNPKSITTEIGNLLAISDDKDKNWKFIRTKSKERLRFLFPKLVDKLNFSDSKIK